METFAKLELLSDLLNGVDSNLEHKIVIPEIQILLTKDEYTSLKKDTSGRIQHYSSHGRKDGMLCVARLYNFEIYCEIDKCNRCGSTCDHCGHEVELQDKY